MTSTDEAIAAARRLAQSAAIADTGVVSCPYPADSTGVQQAARRAWLREYLHRRPPAPGTVSYTDAVTALAHGPDEPDPGDDPPTSAPHLFGEG